MSDRRIVLILGMHRSGTSMLARLLAAEGLPLGETLLRRRTPDNRYGYWEQAEIVAIQEALLDGFDRVWHGPGGLLPLPEGWLHAPETLAAQRRLTAIVDREVSGAGGVWGFKDPRSLRFLPLWRAIIADLGLTSVPILAARAPAAVAGSLMRRNRLGRDFAEALWAANTITLIEATGTGVAAVIDYDGWFAHPEAMIAHLRRAIGLAEPAVTRTGAGMLVDPRLRHHGGDAEAAHPAFQALHEALVADAPHAPATGTLAGPIEAAKAVIDAIRARDRTSRCERTASDS